MKQRELSRLQIRAEVMEILQQIMISGDISKNKLEKYLKQIKSIANIEYALSILVKELTKADYEKREKIASFVIELGGFEQLKSVLWSYIKDQVISDEVKDTLYLILKALGDETEPEVFFSFLKDPKEAIEQETEKLLKASYINPEAQIDFMDFLFSLNEQDQIALLKSLKDDYPEEYLANIVVSVLEARPKLAVQESAINMLGETRSKNVVSILNSYSNSSNLKIQKLAQKSLKMLKLAGIDISKEDPDQRGSVMCEQSKIYECYTNHIDGAGYQGIIVSRIKPNEDIIMFSVVISDLEGIVDCFGFNNISKYDFARILNKFQENSTRVAISPEYCKYKLENAYKLSVKLNEPIPYEYVAWKALIHDFPGFNESIKNKVTSWGNVDLLDQSEILYKHPSLYNWFLEEQDHDLIKPFLDNIIEATKQNKSDHKNNPKELFKWLNEKIDSIIPEIFDERLKELYKDRLFESAYIINLYGLVSIRDIASSLAIGLEQGNKIEEIPFFRKFMRKTIYEGFLRYQYNLNNRNNEKNLLSWNTGKNKDNSPKLDTQLESLDDIIDILEKDWL